MAKERRKMRRLIQCLAVFAACFIAVFLIWSFSTYEDQPASREGQGQENRKEKPEKKLRWEALATCELLAAIGGIAVSWLMIEYLKDDDSSAQGTTPSGYALEDSDEVPGQSEADGGEMAARQSSVRKPSGDKEATPKPEKPKGLFSARADRIQKKIDAIRNESIGQTQREAADLTVKAAQSQADKEINAAQEILDAVQKAADTITEIVQIRAAEAKKRPELFEQPLLDLSKAIIGGKKTYLLDLAASSDFQTENRFKKALLHRMEKYSANRNLDMRTAANLVTEEIRNQLAEEFQTAKTIREGVMNLAATAKEAATVPTDNGGNHAAE